MRWDRNQRTETRTQLENNLTTDLSSNNSNRIQPHSQLQTFQMHRVYKERQPVPKQQDLWWDLNTAVAREGDTHTHIYICMCTPINGDHNKK